MASRPAERGLQVPAGASAPECARQRPISRAYAKARWRDAEGNGKWVWHSLRHVFCTTVIFTWCLEPADVSRMAGHANTLTTWDMYVGATADVLDRARAATE